MAPSQTTAPPSANTNVQAQTSPTSPVTKVHPQFFLEGCDQLLLVQRPTPTYLRVPSYIFRNSAFYDIKSSPDASPGDLVASAERAIIIDEATVEEVTWFIWIFLNPLIDDFSKAGLSHWFTILRLAHLWGFTYVKSMALRYIKPIIEHEIPSLVERIVKYEEYGPPSETLVPLYVELCKRDTPLTDDEWELLEALPGKRLRRVVAVREKLANLKGLGSLPSEAKVEKNIGEALGLIEKATKVNATSSSIGPQPNGRAPAGSSSLFNGGSLTNGGGAPNDTRAADPDSTTKRAANVQLLTKGGGQASGHSMSTLISLIVSLNLVFFWKLL